MTASFNNCSHQHILQQFLLHFSQTEVVQQVSCGTQKDLLSLDHVQKNEIRKTLKKRFTEFSRTNHSQLLERVPLNTQEVICGFLSETIFRRQSFGSSTQQLFFLFLFYLKWVQELHLHISHTYSHNLFFIRSPSYINCKLLQVCFQDQLLTSEGLMKHSQFVQFCICINLSGVLLPQQKILKLASFSC